MKARLLLKYSYNRSSFKLLREIFIEYEIASICEINAKMVLDFHSNFLYSLMVEINTTRTADNGCRVFLCK